MDHIDWTRVQELGDEIGHDDLAEVAAMFIAEVGETIDRLLGTPHLLPSAEDMHFLKGSAVNIGFARLGALCAQGEAFANAGNAARINLTDIAQAFDAAAAEFSTGIEAALTG